MAESGWVYGRMRQLLLNGKFVARDIYDDIQNGVYVLWIIVENDDIIGTLTTRIVTLPES
jgi:hypothetical protein